MPARTTIISRSDTRRRFMIAVGTFLLISVLVIRTSDAAFTANHTNEDNEFATATIDLDSDVDVPLFGEDGVAQTDAMALFPGNEIEACIDIDYSGDLDAADLTAVELSISGATGDLADGLTVTVDLYDECAGVFESSIASASLSGIDDVDTGWTPADDGDSRGFLFTVELDDDDDLQGESLADVDITWYLETN